MSDKVQTLLRLSPDLKRDLKTQAKTNGLTLNAYAARVLSDNLRANQGLGDK